MPCVLDVHSRPLRLRRYATTLQQLNTWRKVEGRRPTAPFAATFIGVQLVLIICARNGLLDSRRIRGLRSKIFDLEADCTVVETPSTATLLSCCGHRLS